MLHHPMLGLGFRYYIMGLSIGCLGFRCQAPTPAKKARAFHLGLEELHFSTGGSRGFLDDFMIPKS